MTPKTPAQSPTPATVVLLATNALLCLVCALLLDLAISDGNTTLIWLSAGLLVVLLALLAQVGWRARKTGFTFPVVESSAVPVQMVWLTLVPLILLATGLRLYRLGAESFWMDEVWTIHSSSQPLLDILRTVNPPTYIPINLLLRFGRSEFILRFSSAFAGILTVPAVYHLGRTLYSRKEGLMAALLFTLSFYAIDHSQELRFYSWQILFSTLSIHFMMRGLQSNQLRDWAGFAISTALNLYNHPVTLMLFASQGLYVAFALTQNVAQSPELHGAPWKTRLVAWARRAVRPAGAAAVAILAYLPQVPALLRFFNPRWIVSMESGLPQPLYYYGTTYLTDPIVAGVYEIFGRFAGVQLYPVFVYLLLSLLLVGLLTSRSKIIVLTLIIALLPPFVVLVGEMRAYPRYWSYFLPLLLALMVHGITYLADSLGRKKWQRLLISTVLLSLVVVPNLARLSLYHSRPEKDQWREAVAVIDAGFQPGDLVLINYFSRLRVQPLEWYATTPEEDLPRRFFPEDGVVTDLGQYDDLPDYTQGYERVWLLLTNQTPEIEAPVLEGMRDSHRQVGDWPFLGVHLILFEAQASGED